MNAEKQNFLIPAAIIIAGALIAAGIYFGGVNRGSAGPTTDGRPDPLELEWIRSPISSRTGAPPVYAAKVDTCRNERSRNNDSRRDEEILFFSVHGVIIQNVERDATQELFLYICTLSKSQLSRTFLSSSRHRFKTSLYTPVCKYVFHLS